jgi:hypothetical protein
MSLPNVTQAQILALITFAAGQAVSFGLLDQSQEQLMVSIGSIVVAAAWKIADAIIRNGRARIAAEQVAKGTAGSLPAPIEPPGDTTEAPAAA